MKILHIVQAYTPSVGGGQWLTQQLAEGIAARYQDEATVFTTVALDLESFWRPELPALAPGVECINGVTVRRFAVFNRFNLLRKAAASLAYRLRLPGNDRLRTMQTGPITPGLRQAIATSGADVVFATAFPLLHMYDALAGARQGHIPIVFLGALHLADRWGYDRPMIYQSIHEVDAYIAHTQHERDYLIEQHGVAAEKIAVIGGGVNADLFMAADGRAIRQAHGWGDAPVVLLLGKHVARKRFDLLIEAMRSVWPYCPTARLVLAGGRTAYTSQIEQMVAQLPPAQRANVTVLADIAETQKPALLAACDLFVLPSAHESFGIALVEAWACARPVIGARSGAIPSVIDEGQDGLLFDYPSAESLAQTISLLLDNPALRIQLGATGQQKVLERYTWAAVVDQVRAVYQKVLFANDGKNETL
jgi:glycosyltransferase involved in cell wall biosynthesis